MKNALLAAALLCVLGSAVAKDYGVQGNIWPITEVDIRRLLIESAARVDWKAVNQEAANSGKNFLSNLPKRQLPLSPQTATQYFDPSMVVESDIKAPVRQPDGSFTWQTLAAKGDRVNPLDKYRPTTAFFMFDGSQKDQVALLEQVLAREPNRIVPVEAGGADLKDLSDSFQRPIFYASDAMLARFKVQYLPSLVYPGTGQHSRYVGVTAYGLPFKADEVLSTWSEIAPKPSAQPQRTSTTGAK